METIHNSFVAIDVEPGGSSVPVGNIGLAEVVRDEVLLATQISFSPWARPSADGTLYSPHTPVNGTYWPSHGIDAALPFVEAFIGDRPVVAYNARYDRGALHTLTQAHDLPNNIRLVDALPIARRVWKKGFRNFSLQSVVLGLSMFTEEEIDERRAIFRRTNVNKWLLHNATDDAWACAQVVIRAQEETGTKTLPELLDYIGLPGVELAR